MLWQQNVVPVITKLSVYHTTHAIQQKSYLASITRKVAYQTTSTSHQARKSQYLHYHAVVDNDIVDCVFSFLSLMLSLLLPVMTMAMKAKVIR